MSIDTIFLEQFNATNKFIDVTISNINNYLKASDINNLISCCKVICNNEESLESNKKLLNDIKDNMEMHEPQISKLEVEFYCFDTAQMFKLLATFSKAVVNNEPAEKAKAIYNKLMYMYDHYKLYKTKF